jgi:4-hydroxy-tetrahydrodipicolinate reductase
VTGMHEVHFLGQGEQLTLTHIAEDRALFARGALAAARFLTGKPPGQYGMRDLVRELLRDG